MTYTSWLNPVISSCFEWVLWELTTISEANMEEDSFLPLPIVVPPLNKTLESAMSASFTQWACRGHHSLLSFGDCHTVSSLWTVVKVSSCSSFKFQSPKESPFPYHIKEDDQTGIPPEIIHSETSQPWLHALSHISEYGATTEARRHTTPTTERKEPLSGLFTGLCSNSSLLMSVPV